MKAARRPVTTRGCLHALLISQLEVECREGGSTKKFAPEIAELSLTSIDRAEWFWHGVNAGRESVKDCPSYAPIVEPSEPVEASVSVPVQPTEPSFMAHRLKVAEQARDDWRGVALALMVLIALFMLGTLTCDGSATRVDPYTSGVPSGVTNGGSWK